MNRKLCKWKGIFFLLMLFFLLFGGNKQVSAASAKCKVVFANARGVVSTPTYKSWERTVKPGQWINLPEYSWSGYRCYWEEKSGNTVKRYSPGAKYKVTKNTKFCLHRYELYDVKFYSEDGKKEHKDLRKQAIKGENITLPSVPHSSTTMGLGWSTTANAKTYQKPGTKIKINGDMKFYSKTQTITSVNLYKYDGKFWKSVPTNTGSTPVFPSVNLGSINMCLGWSKTMGKNSRPEYYAGDRIPTKTGNYYMVIFGPEDDKAPSYIRTPEGYDMVYFVGDSRTIGLQWGLGSRKPSNVDFVADSGEGLEWFERRDDTGGYKNLYRKVRKIFENSGGRARQAVIINLGVNDLWNSSSYIDYMRRVSQQLRGEFRCDMYYMSVNPVNSAMIKAYGGTYRTEAQVAAFNKSIRMSLCSGSNNYFTYIDACTALQKYGWISNFQNKGIYDGVHYSYQTYLRIYDYCIRNLRR